LEAYLSDDYIVWLDAEIETIRNQRGNNLDDVIEKCIVASLHALLKAKEAYLTLKIRDLEKQRLS